MSVVDLSIVIPVWNTWDLAIECLASIDRHTAASWEAVAVDNGSEGGPPADIGVAAKLVRLERNYGFAGGTNRGAEVTNPKSRAICLLNSDTLVTPGWERPMLAALGQQLRGHPIGGVGPMTSNAAGKQMDGTAVYLDEDDFLAHAAARAQRHGDEMLPVPFLSGFCLMVSREAWEKVGPLDERFFPGNFDDNDWCIRAMKAGYSLAVCLGSYVHHHGQQTFKRNGVSCAKALHENRVRFLEKWENGGPEAERQARGEVGG